MKEEETETESNLLGLGIKVIAYNRPVIKRDFFVWHLLCTIRIFISMNSFPMSPHLLPFISHRSHHKTLDTIHHDFVIGWIFKGLLLKQSLLNYNCWMLMQVKNNL